MHQQTVGRPCLRSGFRLNEWEVIPHLNRIRKGTETITLEPKLMGVLLALAENAGQVVSREELIEKVWPKTHVSETLVRRAISRLRQHLGDDAREPIYVQTVPKAGYRLIGVIVDRPADPDDTPIFNATVPQARRARRWGWAGWLVLACLLLAFALAYYRLDSKRPWQSVLNMSEMKGRERDPVIDPGGGRLAFVWAEGNQQMICAKALGTQRAHQVSDLFDHLISPAWSPGGDRLAYVHQGEEFSTIYTSVIDELFTSQRRVRSCGFYRGR